MAGKATVGMRDYNKMPLSVIAKAHNSPAAQPWVRTGWTR